MFLLKSVKENLIYPMGSRKVNKTKKKERKIKHHEQNICNKMAENNADITADTWCKWAKLTQEKRFSD